jgi:lipoate-protein ligase A
MLDLTFPTPAENLACDEALLEAHDDSSALLRFWEPEGYFVVLGYSNIAEAELRSHACRMHGIPVFRRSSGGGAVLQGPGCLNYALVMSVEDYPQCATITGANTYIMHRHRAALQPLIKDTIEFLGHSDLAVGGRKFSGNAQRRKERTLLFHGTFLVDFDIALIEETLRLPARRPRYRNNRNHGEFLTNLGIPREYIKQALQQAWHVAGKVEQIPSDRIAHLVRSRYALPQWNYRR